MAVYHGAMDDGVLETEHTHVVFVTHPQNKVRAIRNIAQHSKHEFGELLTTCQPVKSIKNLFAYLKSHQIKDEFIGGKFNSDYVQLWNNVTANDMSCAMANREYRKRKREITENVVVKRQKIANLVDLIDEYNIQVCIYYNFTF